MFQTPLALLKATVAAKPAAIGIKCARLDDAAVLQHQDISYAALWDEIEDSASFWAHKLSDFGVGQSSTVGIWLNGSSYLAFVQTWGLMRAGFVPQLFSLELNHPEAIYPLLKKGSAGALIYDSSRADLLQHCPIPAFSLEERYQEQGTKSRASSQPPLPAYVDAEQVLLVFHTSGSTSASPKLVPQTARWLDFAIRKISWQHLRCSKDQAVDTLMGSMAHMGAFLQWLELVYLGGCLIFPSAMPVSACEFEHMIRHCGLTRWMSFGPNMSKMIAHARRNSSLQEAMQQLDQLYCSGVTLDPTDQEWLREQDITFIEGFGSSELGKIMRREPGCRLFQPWPGTTYEFLPVQASAGTGKTRLLELVVPPSCPDCPVSALRSKEDGKFHTGDLFVEIEPGRYLSEGRDDDWIRLERLGRCDTKSLEVEVLRTCGNDLVSVAVVVGEGRPLPALFVELPAGGRLQLDDGDGDISTIRGEIIKRIAPFCKTRYMQEQITDDRLVFVVPSSSLPRSGKGSIRRRAVQEQYVAELDRAYAAIAACTYEV